MPRLYHKIKPYIVVGEQMSERFIDFFDINMYVQKVRKRRKEKEFEIILEGLRQIQSSLEEIKNKL